MHKMRQSNQPPKFEFPQNVQTHFSQPTAWQHTFYLGAIGGAEDYYEWFEIIRNASPNDDILININSPGGNYATALQFRRAMQESMANISCSIEGECHSAASIIYLSADSFTVSEGSNMLLHDYSGIVGGKGSEMIRQIQHEKVSIDSFLESVYEDFITPAEIKTVLSGQDFWLDHTQIIERTRKMVEDRVIAEAKEELAAQEAETKPTKQSKKK